MLDALSAKLAHWAINRPVAVLVFSLGVVLASLLGVKNLYFTSNYRIYFSEDNPRLETLQEIEARFSERDTILLVLAPEDGDVFARDNLQLIVDITDEAWQTPYSTRVDSIANFQHTYSDDGDLIVESLFEYIDELEDDDIRRRKEVALGERSLLHRLINADASVTGVLITVSRPGDDEFGEIRDIMDFVHGLRDQISSQRPDVKVAVTGTVASDAAFAEASIQDSLKLFPLAALVMTGALLLMLRSVLGTVLTLLIIGLSVAVSLGFAGYMGYAISPATAAGPTVILTMAIADSVHVLVSYFNALRRGIGKNAALAESLRVNLNPMLVTSLTTAIGFLSLNLSDVPPFRALGNIVAVGVMAAFFFAGTYLPAMIRMLPVKPPRAAGAKESPRMRRLAEFILDHTKLMMLGFTAIVLATLAWIPKNQLNDVLLYYFSEDFEFRRDTDFTTENLTGMYFIEYGLSAGEENGINNPAFMRELDRFARWFREQEEVLHVNVVTDVVKRVNKAMNDDAWRSYVIPGDPDSVAQLLLVYEMSLPYGLDLNDQVDVTRSGVRMTVTTRTLSSAELIALEERAQAWLLSHSSQMDATLPTGGFTLFSHVAEQNIRSMLLATAIALVLISDLLILALSSVPFGLLSLIPNFLPIAMGFGVWGVTMGEIGLSLSIVSSMTLGIVVDDTVHMLSKYLRARRELGLSSRDAVIYAYETVGGALVITSAVLVLGFLVLATSDFNLNATMGMLTALIIALALFVDLFFLPPLLVLLDKITHLVDEDDEDPYATMKRVAK